VDKKEIYYKYIQEKLMPMLYPLEEYRLKLVRKVVLSSVFMFLAGILFAFIFIYISYKHTIALLLLPIFLFLMYMFFIKSIVNIMWEGRKYQNWLVDKILPYFFEPVANFKFWPKNNDVETVINSKLFKNFETREDILAIFGIYNKTNIIISNTNLTLPVKSSIKSNLFKGTLIQLELPFSINNHIILNSKNEPKNNNFKQINPHIDELNKFLYVFAKNEENKVISEYLWQIIKRFGADYIAKSFQMSINNDVVLIALKQKNPWIFGFLFKSLLKEKNYDELIERFIVIYDSIDYFMQFY